MTLFNTNYLIEKGNLTESEEVIINIVASNEKIVRKDVEEALGISQTMAGRVLKSLVEKGKIIKQGSGSKTHYLGR